MYRRMKMQKFLQKIQAALRSLPHAQMLVGEYVLIHYKNIPFLSVTELAEKIGVSETTVFKFCGKLGYTGYMPFRRKLASLVQNELTTYQNLEDRTKDLSGTESIFEQVLKCDMHNIETTLRDPLNHRNFERLQERLQTAKTIYICGFRSASTQAQYLGMTLRIQGKNVRIITPDTGNWAEVLCEADENDLFITFLFSRYSKQSVDILRYMHKRGVTCCALTDSAASPAYSLCDIPFICENDSCYYQGSYTGCMALINTIITASSLADKDRTTDHLKKVEKAFAEFDTFFI